MQGRSAILLFLLVSVVDEGSTFHFAAITAADRKKGFSLLPFVALPMSQKDDSSLPEETPGEDWRAFRAKLVLQEKQQQQQQRSSSSSSSTTTDGDGCWAYEAGNVIETGSIILSRAQQDFGYGIRQQYFHKCVILVLHHHDRNFTKGVILNRPTDLRLGDGDFVNQDGKPLDDDLDDDEEHRWKVWFGGDVQWIHSSSPDVVCLHSLTSAAAHDISETVMKEIQWTTLAGARKLVREGSAEPEDFYVVCGYAGWGAGQLLNELERGCWYMAATDSQTLLMELRKQDRGTDPRDAGLETWKLLMERIGKEEEANGYEGGFDDLMLREWAKEKLIFTTKSVEDTEQNVKEMVLLAASLIEHKDVGAGRMLRSSSSQRPPFLLDNQEFHHSLVLIIQDNPIVSIGIILNLPSNRTVEVDVVGGDGIKRKAILPVRFGGRYGVKEEKKKPIFWYHCNEILRDAKVGTPVGDDHDGIWSCTQEDAEVALELGMATPSDFIVVGGFSIWPKGPGTVGGLLGEVLEGHFEPVPKNKTEVVWSMLRENQEALAVENIDSVLAVTKSIWISAGGASNDPGDKVYKSETTVQSLADDALKSWMAAILLKDPKLRLQS